MHADPRARDALPAVVASTAYGVLVPPIVLLAAVLAAERVSFVLVGSAALWLRGEDVPVADVDAVPEPGPANLARLPAPLARMPRSWVDGHRDEDIATSLTALGSAIGQDRAVG